MFSHPGGSLSRTVAPSRRKEPVEVVQALDKDATWSLSREVFQAYQVGIRPRGNPGPGGGIVPPSWHWSTL